MLDKLSQKVHILSFWIDKNFFLIKKVLLWISMISLLVLIFPSQTYKNFGEYAWYLLILTMMIRPLHDIFPKFKIFGILMKFRQEFGILVGVFALAHFVGYLWDIDYDISRFVTNPFTRDPSRMVFWWILALLVAIPLTITSNLFFMKLFRTHRKTLQRLSYLMFVFVAIHIFLLKKEIWPIIVVLAWIILFVIAHFQNKKPKF